MMTAAAFAQVGEDLLNLAAGLARATQGQFTGETAVVRETAGVYAEAACNAFAALAGMEGMGENERAAAGGVAAAFRTGMAALATYFPMLGQVTTLAPLGMDDPAQPARLAAYFGPGTALVSVTANAREALETLRRDPLLLVALGVPGLLGLMATVTAGVRVRQP